MHAFNIKVLAAIALSAVSVSALASGSCTSEPKSKWLSEKEVQAKLEKQGYSVKRIKTEDNCYEAYVLSKDGRKGELVVNPVDGALVKDERKS